jgi:soluble cytochrome b562
MYANDNRSADWKSGMDIGQGLHDLALQYWTEGRIDDARRIAEEAARVVENEESAASLRAGIASILEALDHA